MERGASWGAVVVERIWRVERRGARGRVKVWVGGVEEGSDVVEGARR